MLDTRIHGLTLLYKLYKLLNTYYVSMFILYCPEILEGINFKITTNLSLNSI